MDAAVDLPLDPTPVDPAEAGVDADRLAALVDRARRETVEGGGVLPAVQIAVARHGRVVLHETLGDAGPGARFNIFSLTKAVVAAAVWQLLAEERMRPSTWVSDLVPAFSTNDKKHVTVEQLLTHTAGFPHAPMGPPEWFERDTRIERMSSWRLNWEPGSRMEYHASSAHWVLAEIIEVLDGRDYRDSVYERVCLALGLDGLRLGATVIHPDDWAGVTDIAIVGEAPDPGAFEEATGLPGVDLGEVTDTSTLRYNDPAVRDLGVPGGGGIGDAAQVALLHQAFLHNPGRLWDPHWLEQGTQKVWCSMEDPLIAVPSNRTLGLILAGDDGHAPRRGFGKTVSGRAFGHLGLGAQAAWADPATGLSFCFLTNGHDVDLLAQGLRTHALSTRAGALVDGPPGA